MSRFSECDLRIILKRRRDKGGNPWEPWASHLPQKDRYTGKHNPHKPGIYARLNVLITCLENWHVTHRDKNRVINLHNAQFEEVGAATAHGYASSWKTNLAKLEAYASILWQNAWEWGDSKTKFKCLSWSLLCEYLQIMCLYQKCMYPNVKSFHLCPFLSMQNVPVSLSACTCTWSSPTTIGQDNPPNHQPKKKCTLWQTNITMEHHYF